MKKQLIIAIGREFGSEGHIIGEELAGRFEIPYFDNNLLHHVAEEKDISHEHLVKYDEVPKNKLISRRIRGMSNSPQENIAYMQFDFLKKMAGEGKSFVVVGRCAEAVLKGTPGLISIFVTGNKEHKTHRVMETHEISKKEAHRMMKQMDQKRKNYHNYYSEHKWGHCHSYDISVNSSYLGVEGTTDMLEMYIRKRMEENM